MVEKVSPSARTKKGEITKKLIRGAADKESGGRMKLGLDLTYEEKKRWKQAVFKACGGKKIERDSEGTRKAYSYYMNPGPEALNEFLRERRCHNLRDYLQRVAAGTEKLPA